MAEVTTWVIRDNEEPKFSAMRWLKAWRPDPNKPIVVKVEPFKKNRSLEQNKRYWAILKQLADHMAGEMDGVWHSPEVWHELMKKRFLGFDVIEVDGEAMEVVRSTRKLKVSEFADYMTEVEVWAAEHGMWSDWR